MPNTGTATTTFPGMWESPIFRELFDTPWEMIEAVMVHDKIAWVPIKTAKIKAVLEKYVSEDTLRKHYKREFLENPEEFPSVCAYLNEGEVDAVHTLADYSPDTRLAGVFRDLFPDIETTMKWSCESGSWGNVTYKNGDIIKQEVGEY